MQKWDSVELWFGRWLSVTNISVKWNMCCTTVFLKSESAKCTLPAHCAVNQLMGVHLLLPAIDTVSQYTCSQVQQSCLKTINSQKVSPVRLSVIMEMNRCIDEFCCSSLTVTLLLCLAVVTVKPVDVVCILKKNEDTPQD